MSAKSALIFICMVLTGVAPTAVHAAENSCGPWGISTPSEPIGHGLTPQDADDYWTRPCSDNRCRAARDLACAFDAMVGRDFPNSMARGDPSSYDRELARIYNPTIRGLGSVHPNRIPLYCDLLAKVAALDDDTIESGREVTRWTTELAVRLTRPHLDCIGQVMTAFPRSAEMDGARIVQPPAVAR